MGLSGVRVCMSFLPDGWIPFYMLERVLCGHVHVGLFVKIYQTKKSGHLNHMSPSGVVPLVPSLPQLKETMFVWRQACIFWACLPLLLACACVRFPSFSAGFQVLLVLGTLNIHEVIYYLFQSWEGYKNIPHWQCLWIAFTISSTHHPHVCFPSCACLQSLCAGLCVGCILRCPATPSQDCASQGITHHGLSFKLGEGGVGNCLVPQDSEIFLTALGILHSTWAWFQPGIPDSV